ncbi:MAG: acyl-CoA-binding protein [Bacteroidota bacterium]
MNDLAQRFESAATKAKGLPKQSNDILLKLYALYKQSTNGDVSGKRPGTFNLTGRAKYDAWAKLEGTASETAMEQYIQLVEDLS